MSSEQLQAAITAVKSGQTAHGRTLLLDIVSQEPGNEVAWLWLSVVVDSLEDQIIALENALTINPDRLQTQTRLAKLQAKIADPVEVIFNRAEAAIKNGRTQDARNLLIDLVEEYPAHEQAWWQLSQLVDNRDDQITALENVLQLNPQHRQAQAQLRPLQAARQDPLALGRQFEQQGNLEQAKANYKQASKKAANKTDRLIAKNRLKVVKSKLKHDKVIKTTSPIVTLARLSLGPPLLYGLLIFLQSGLNPTKIPIIACVGGIGVIVGSLLIVSGQHIPRDPLWQRFFGDEGLNSQNQFLVTLLGLLMLVIPFLFLVLSAINRLQPFRAFWGLSS